MIVTPDLSIVGERAAKAAARMLEQRGYHATASGSTVTVQVKSGRCRYRVTIINDIQPAGDERLHDRLADAYAAAVVRQAMG